MRRVACWPIMISLRRISPYWRLQRAVKLQRRAYDLLAATDVSQLRSATLARHRLVNLTPAAIVHVSHSVVPLFDLRIGTTWYFTEEEGMSTDEAGTPAAI